MTVTSTMADLKDFTWHCLDFLCAQGQFLPGAINSIRVDKNDHLWDRNPETGLQNLWIKKMARGIRSETPLIFPNPAKNYVMAEQPRQHFAIRISDITGKVRIDVRVSGNSVKLDVGNLASGIYILQVIDGTAGFSRN